jgi:hypothetical protein
MQSTASVSTQLLSVHNVCEHCAAASLHVAVHATRISTDHTASHRPVLLAGACRPCMACGEGLTTARSGSTKVYDCIALPGWEVIAVGLARPCQEGEA